MHPLQEEVYDDPVEHHDGAAEDADDGHDQAAAASGRDESKVQRDDIDNRR